jgi:citrate lyase subunit beta/citryl-CoA lyase
MPITATAGNKGGKIRSDCFVTMELMENGGVDLLIHSKVKSLYGSEIKELALDILKHYKIENARLIIEDSGALNFVIAARIEAVIRKITGSDQEYLLPPLLENIYSTQKESYRFSRLYIPGNSPSMMLNAGIHKPNGIILDLEDSVAFDKKEEARILVRNALCQVNFYGAERMVRINQVPAGIQDIKFLVPHHVNLLLIPKCESAKQISMVELEIERVSKIKSIKNPVFLMPIIESALGVEKAFEIAQSSKNIVGLAMGLEDYTADLGTRRTQEGWESFFARTRIVNACKAAGIQAIDSVFSDVGDDEGLRETIKVSKSLGFEGMGCIHPRQIKIIHEGFAPDLQEIEYAEKVINAFLNAKAEGLGVVSLGTKMIDSPVVKRAQKIIDLALNLKMIDQNWREKYVSH